MSKDELLEHERTRINTIIDSIASRDWNHFKSSSDEPFINDQAMKDNFLATCPLVDTTKSTWQDNYNVSTSPQGLRYIRISLLNKISGKNNIALDLQSDNTSRDISIFVFYEESDYS